jgi:hypothetical protein
MTRDEIVTLIKRTCGYRKTGDSDIVENMNLVQIQLERGPTYPWFLLSERAQILCSIGDERIPLPNDFLAEDEDDTIWIEVTTDDPTTQEPLAKDEKDLLRDKYRNSSGQPVAYAMSGEYVRLFPIPDAAYKLWMQYYQKQESVLSGNIENKWLKYAPEVIMGEAGYLYAAGLRDSNAMAVFDTMRKSARLVLEVENEEKKHSNRRYQIGGPH